MKSVVTFLILIMACNNSFAQTINLPGEAGAMTGTASALNQVTPEENEKDKTLGPQDEQEKLYKEESEQEENERFEEELREEQEADEWQQQIEGSRFDEPD